MPDIFIRNDNVLELNGLKNRVNDTYINDATVAVTLYDENGVAGGNTVSGQSWPVTMDYVAASNGIYRATLQDVLNLAEHQRYVAHISADGGAGLQGDWEVDLSGVVRTEKDYTRLQGTWRALSRTRRGAGSPSP